MKNGRQQEIRRLKQLGRMHEEIKAKKNCKRETENGLRN